MGDEKKKAVCRDMGTRAAELSDSDLLTVDGGLIVDRGEGFSGGRYVVIGENGRAGRFDDKSTEEQVKKSAWAMGGSNHIVPLDVAKELRLPGWDIVDWQ